MKSPEKKLVVVNAIWLCAYSRDSQTKCYIGEGSPGSGTWMARKEGGKFETVKDKDKASIFTLEESHHILNELRPFTTLSAERIGPGVEEGAPSDTDRIARDAARILGVWHKDLFDGFDDDWMDRAWCSRPANWVPLNSLAVLPEAARMRLARDPECSKDVRQIISFSNGARNVDQPYPFTGSAEDIAWHEGRNFALSIGFEGVTAALGKLHQNQAMSAGELGFFIKGSPPHLLQSGIVDAAQMVRKTRPEADEMLKVYAVSEKIIENTKAPLKYTAPQVNQPAGR